MAAGTNFYSPDPYLHSSPKLHNSSRPDRFRDFGLTVSYKDLNKDFTEASLFLQHSINEAVAVETKFFSAFKIFGVTDAQSFSEMFLVPTAIEDYDEAYAKIMASKNLVKKIHFILNNPYLQQLLTEHNPERMLKLLENFLTKEALAKAQHLISDPQLLQRYGGDFLRQTLIAQGSSKGPIKFSAGRGRGSTITLNKGDMNLSSDLLQKYIPKTAITQQLSFSKDNISRAMYIIRQEELEHFEEASGRAISWIRNTLNKEITDEDVLNFVHPAVRRKATAQTISKRRSAIIHQVVEEMKVFLNAEMNKKKGSLYHIQPYVTGELLNFGLEVAVNVAFRTRLGKNFSKIARSIGEVVYRTPFSSMNKEVPSDLDINGILMQLKSSRVPDKMKPNHGIELSKGRYLTSILQQMQYEGLTSQDGLERLQYTIVNMLHRRDFGTLSVIADKLINWAVEIYVRSNTVSSFIEKVSDANYPRQGDLKYIAQNSFWVVENKLIPVSTFLKAAQAVLSEHRDIEKWYTASSNPITSSVSIVDSNLLRQKLEAAPNDGDGLNLSVEEYDPQVIAIGKNAGAQILKATQIGRIGLSNSFVTNINDIISRLG